MNDFSLKRLLGQSILQWKSKDTNDYAAQNDVHKEGPIREKKVIIK
jgi:hypothetical protein